MRVLMLTHNRAWESGTFLRAFSLAAGLVKLGHQVVLFAARQQPGLHTMITTHKGVEIIQPPDVMPTRIRHAGFSPFEIVARWRYLDRKSFDVIHGFEHRPSVLWPILHMHGPSKPIYVKDWADLWGFNGLAADRGLLSKYLLGHWDQRGERAAARLADGVTVISQYLLSLTQTLHVDKHKVRYIPVGADPHQIQPKSKEEARRAANLPRDDKILVYMGFSHYDAPVLGKTLSNLVAMEPRIKLLLIGPHLERFVAQLNREGLEAHILHIGQVPYSRLGSWLACGDIMLLPYANNVKNEARFPHRFGDFLAAGRPIITNPTGDLGRLVQGENIGVTALESAAALAEEIYRLLNAPEQMEEMGRQARNLAETRLSWQALACQIADFYLELAER